MQIQLPENWKIRLNDAMQQSYFQDLMRFVKQEYEEHICYPNANDIFAAFHHCSFEHTKVVIIGQDPYHGPGQANGLSFSVKDDQAHPPSLKNIFKELNTDLGVGYPESGNLERWAKQGVLLLNATLTVRAHQAGSHQRKGWEKFTNAVIKKIVAEKKDVVFMLWGGFAQKKVKLITSDSHQILTSGHPSPLSANRGLWFGNQHFSQCNTFLKSKEIAEIFW